MSFGRLKTGNMQRRHVIVDNNAKFEVWNWYGFGDGDMFLKSESYEI
jgi:hypothetical protein